MKFVFLFLVIIAQITSAETPGPLKSYKIDPTKISISGVSSGAFMAVQMGVAYSKTFSAVSSVAGGVYWCAQGDFKRAQAVCMKEPKDINVEDQINQAKRWDRAGAIDALDNLKKQKLFVFSSQKDAVIPPENSAKLQKFYEAFTESKNIKIEKSSNAAHGFPTLSYGNLCGIMGVPWLLKCGYDLAANILEDAYNQFAVKGQQVASHLLSFSQDEFGNEDTPLYANGWVYVPDDCARGETCALHIALHGCQMNPDFVQDKFATHAGYNDWAEANKIIVLYPQSKKDLANNPFACWDWYGFTGKDYATKNGFQMMALKKMVDRISSKF